jgi:predicted oxidoreductase
MVTVGGLMTDKYCNVLGESLDPIPGLYAAGNCLGQRFGAAYFSPIPGVSIGSAITLGYTLGEHLAES